MDFLVNYIQSAIIDCKVLQQLSFRGGIDVTQFHRDIVSVAVDLIEPLGQGMKHGHRYTDIVAACSLAVPSAFSDLYKLKEADRKAINALWKIAGRFEPEMADLANAMTRYGFHAQAGAVKSIDACLAAAFDFLGTEFRCQTDLIPRYNQMGMLDKMPHFAPGMPYLAKHALLRESILRSQQILRATNRPGEGRAAIIVAPLGAPFSVFNLPKIVGAAFPKEATDPMEINRLTAQGMDVVVMTDEIDIYEEKYVFTEANASRVFTN